jgi:peroxiredoxin
MGDLALLRDAVLRDERLALFGQLPAPGERLLEIFSIPAARRAIEPLTEQDLAVGLVLVSTLPNIERHACLAQIVDLDEHAAHRLPHARIVHVSSDEARHWAEVDRYHPTVRAAAYSLRAADEQSRTSFKWGFGVGVLGHERIAHGLFALARGVFLAADVPYDQMRPPAVERFLDAVAAAAEVQPCG